ncbi:MAG: tRNA 2-thiouridine(34) synthase MnmA [Candidatus Pacebacteria bacterium]|nr:tRNA 2-thiouridine(34) synthase MnmA [Candidatus Paceibacterota bacterium]
MKKIKDNLKNKKVFIGMSGGVDSSVSALLLKKQKYDVTGVFIKVWQPDFIECTWKEDRQDAMRICAELEIPFITLDLEKEYKKEVIDSMIIEYKKGKTPNPDVFCNKEVKFGAFLSWALKNGADFVATGHYAKKDLLNNKLMKAKDKTKDQSYFLWTLTKKELKKIIFPIGDLLKEDVRKIAIGNNLATAKKKDSQGLCFIGKIDVKDFLKEFIKVKYGKVLNKETKNKLGEHEGSVFYTIGEKIFGEYVIVKDLKKNILYTSKEKLNVSKDYKENKFEITLEEINFESKLKKGEVYFVAERYHAKETEIKILSIKENIKEKSLIFKFDLLNKNQSFVYTSGQSLVFYKKEYLVGAGIMK